jgi:shikimate kinase
MIVFNLNTRTQDVASLARAVEATKEELAVGEKRYMRMKEQVGVEKTRAEGVISSAAQVEAKLKAQLDFLSQEQARLNTAKAESAKQQVGFGVEDICWNCWCRSSAGWLAPKQRAPCSRLGLLGVC